MPRKTDLERLGALETRAQKSQERAKKAARGLRAAHKKFTTTATKVVGRRARDNGIRRLAMLDDEIFERLLRVAEDPRELDRVLRLSRTEREIRSAPSLVPISETEAAE